MSAIINDNKYQVNIEKAVLCAVLFDCTIMENFADTLASEMFFLPAHGEIYRVMLELHKEDLPIDEDFILKRLDLEIANEQVLVEIMTATAISKTDAYVFEIVENYKRRVLVTILNAARLGHNDGKSSEDMIDELTHSLEDLESKSGGAEIKTAGEWDDYYAGLPPIRKLKTDLMVVDAVTSLDGGIEAGQFVFISGKKETGKTYFATTIMENLAANGVKCGFFSMEFGTRSYIKKIEEKYPHKDNAKRVAIMNNVYVEHRVNDINDMEKKIKKMVKKGVEYIFVDSQLRVGNAGLAKATKAERLADVFSRLGLLCQRHELIIAMVVQTSKADHDAEEVSVKGCIDADHECGVWFHFTKHSDSETRTILIAKNKQNFKRRKVDVRFDPINHSFKIINEHDLDKGAAPQQKYNRENSEPEVTTYMPDDADDCGLLDTDMPDIF